MTDDEYGSFQVVMLCETEQCLVIAFTWDGQGGYQNYFLAEQDGSFVAFINESWHFSGGEYYKDMYDQ